MKDVVDNELKGVQAECSELKKRVTELEDGHKVMCERERKQQEQILYLSNVKDKCEQLERKNMELEVEKDRLEEELDKKNGELDEEKRRECVGLEDKLNDLSSKKDAVERKNGELEVEKNKLEKELDDSMAVCNDLKDQNAHLQALMTDSADLDSSENDASDNDEENNSRNEESQTGTGNDSEEIMSESRSRSKEIMNETRGENEEFMSERSSGSEGNQGEPSADSDEEALPTAGIMSESRNRSEGIISETRKESEESLIERSSGNEGIQRQASVDLDDEALPDVGGDQNFPIDIESDSVVEISDSENDDDSPPNYRLDERLISCKKKFPLSSTSKRKWGAETGTSEIKTEDEDKRKKLDAGKNVLLELFSLEMQTPSVRFSSAIAFTLLFALAPATSFSSLVTTVAFSSCHIRFWGAWVSVQLSFPNQMFSEDEQPCLRRNIEAIESSYPVVTVNSVAHIWGCKLLIRVLISLLTGDAFTVSEVASPVVAP
ncbi:tax1-binding protein 1 homolog A-like [Papaver somniferum]|uniref:tax1-binding protein 1 homolog A-like n=1 Tax=Papaver somniferum TaxID=3469 RepID=UPI000E6FDD58|nr:tax1-binding protein 1 homolog A-like [Papaver somniferum]